MRVDSLQMGILDMDGALNRLARIEQRSAILVAWRFIGETAADAPQRCLADRELRQSTGSTAGNLNG